METLVDCGFLPIAPKGASKPPEERDCGFSGTGVPLSAGMGAEHAAPLDSTSSDSSAPVAAKRRK